MRHECRSPHVKTFRRSAVVRQVLTEHHLHIASANFSQNHLSVSAASPTDFTAKLQFPPSSKPTRAHLFKHRRLSREQYRAFEISIAPFVPSFVSSYCPRCIRKSVSPSPVLYPTDSLKGSPVLYAFRCLNKCINSTCIYHSPRLCGTLCWSCD